MARIVSSMVPQNPEDVENGFIVNYQVANKISKRATNAQQNSLKVTNSLHEMRIKEEKVWRCSQKKCVVQGLGSGANTNCIIRVEWQLGPC